jgi:hypothetical protein
MNKNTYVIITTGRTGSHMIFEMLSGPMNTRGGMANAIGCWYPLNTDIIKNSLEKENLVIHAHSIDVVSQLNLDPSQITAILSCRKDLFLQVMSISVCEITKEWSGKDYSNKTLLPKHVDKLNFFNTIKTFKNWPSKLNLPPQYKKIATVYYEDLVEQGAPHLANVLGIDYKDSMVGKVFDRSPYSYKDWVLNWEDLQQEYLKIKDDIDKLSFRQIELKFATK